MFKPLVFCSVVWFFSWGGASQDQLHGNRGDHWERPLLCHDNPEKFKVTMYLGNLSRRADYHFGCTEENSFARVYIDLWKPVLGLEGSRAWCYETDAPRTSVEIECVAKMTKKIGPRAFPSHTCTLWNNTEQKWFHVIAKKDGNVTCRIWGAHMNETFSFYVSGLKVAETSEPVQPAHASSSSSSELSALSSSTTPSRSHSKSISKSPAKTKTPSASRPSPAVTKPSAPKPDVAKHDHVPSKIENSPAQAIPAAKPSAADQQADEQKAKEKPGSAFGSTERPVEESENASGASDALGAQKGSDALSFEGGALSAQPAAETSHGHANAAIALSLPALLVWRFSAYPLARLGAFSN
ncbi:hypothetical protein, conserved in T. vivax [Trypanosoma vivax Y486]|uniref:Uncharacterized protein n=1 Tax=Trypanosoma vivax (strain Y486) TaxID=1055687 RepID=F9WU50_TRYVY|nr:hypothetical protein, conserved in T. vivax [Trypanosoma vivax Y486]|eukprot:CCD21098.1 hypothetical protein, conserved in T. vivax [Trypanosoma vivax Y486]